MSFTDIWDSTFEAYPDDNNYGFEIDNYIRRVQTAVRERMQVDHIWMVGVTDGGHNKVSLAAQGSNPTSATGYGFLYTKTVSGVVELFYEDSAGNVKQVTSNGILASSFLPIINSDIYDSYANENYGSKNLDLVANPNEWKVFYVGKYGELIELALGSTSGVPLVSNGADAAPSFSPIANAAINTNAIATTNIQNEAVTAPKIFGLVVAGTAVTLASAPTLRSTTSATYTLLKSVQMVFGGTVTVKFSMDSPTTSTIYGQVYKNGVAYGTERSTASFTPVTFSQDLTFAAGDLVQIYVKSPSTNTADVSDFLVQCGEYRATVITD
jgi:hypothetical protein